MSIEQFVKNANRYKKKRSRINEKKDIEEKFVAYASNKKCKALKLILLNLKGFPDRTVLCPQGRVFFIEFKTPGKKAQGIQSKWHTVLKSFGFKVYVCDNLTEAKTILCNFLDSA